MSEITKLYENAGIKPTYTDECQMADSYYSMAKDLNERGILFDDYMKQECPNKNEVCYETCPYAYNKEFYPPFTAEKQIAIIKLISKQGLVSIENWEKENRGFNVTFRANSNLRYITMDCITRKTVEEALAQIVNDLWQDLSEKEKQQVKNILEMNIQEVE